MILHLINVYSKEAGEVFVASGRDKSIVGVNGLALTDGVGDCG